MILEGEWPTVLIPTEKTSKIRANMSTGFKNMEVIDDLSKSCFVSHESGSQTRLRNELKVRKLRSL